MAVFTWYGCTLEIQGSCEPYIAGETPQIAYINVHTQLEAMRNDAADKGIVGPRVTTNQLPQSAQEYLPLTKCATGCRGGSDRLGEINVDRKQCQWCRPDN
jgi:hypothetical protein